MTTSCCRCGSQPVINIHTEIRRHPDMDLSGSGPGFDPTRSRRLGHLLPLENRTGGSRSNRTLPEDRAAAARGANMKGDARSPMIGGKAASRARLARWLQPQQRERNRPEHTHASRGPRDQNLAVRIGPNPAKRVARSGALFRSSVAGNAVVSSRKKRFVFSVSAGMEEAEAGP